MASTGQATSPVTPKDAASAFTCGQVALDSFFARHAVENHEKGIGTTFVLWGTGEGDPPVLGSYPLSMSAVPAEALRKALGRNLPRYPKLTVLADPGVPTARHRVVLPSPLPGERDPGLRRAGVDAGEQAVHPQAIGVLGERDESRTEDVEAVVHPLAGLDDTPPTVELF